jgi:hypothetical protein
MGMMIAGVAKSGNQASNIGVILGLVLAVIGGCLPMAGGSTYRAGGFIGTLARLTPHAHALEGYFRLMMENGTVVTVLPQMGILFWFDDLTVTHTDQNETVLTGPIVDQAALHGLLAKLRDLGLSIVSVNLSEEADQKAATE